MSYGHPTQLIVKKNGNTEDTITWHQTNNRWQGSSHFLLLTIVASGKRWQIQEFYQFSNGGTLNGPIVAVGDTFTNGEANNSPVDSSYSNNWTVSEPTTTSTTTSEPAGTNPPPGGQGDPHIQPFFGKKYTI